MQVHFIGLGEANLSNLAVALQKKGETITGSDEVFDESLTSLMKGQGLLSNETGWSPSKIHAQLDAVVIGSSVKQGNPELVKAQELGHHIFSYPEFLYELSKYKTRVVVAGSQCKTTIATMILHVLDYNDVAADYASSAPHGIHLTEENDFIVIEGDSSLSGIDGTPQLQLYQPNIALLSDIRFENNGVYSGFENYVEQYSAYVDGIVKGGSITYNEEDEEVRKLVESSENPIRKFLYGTPDYQEVDGEFFLDTPDGEMPLEISRTSDLRNMAGAKWICQQMGVDEVEFYEAMATYK
ncbi:Mur ligase domain-containing protein [Allomuricauda sp. F6463D]|uniref:Mur ligase domain-containing protein n=1 Tax=Allomuricauda sp. F6463D TaxID=2926409 RepID=UPI001FF12025|nr:Mur ligase domain-containing protein [Muricauda sp. F6463D]MCK0160654.1 Mur ligase domain-containing protein [Muricauda sp. F6463D]